MGAGRRQRASPVSYGAVVSPFLPDTERVAAAREALPATSAGIYLDTATAGPIPAEVAAAMAQVAEWDLRTGRVHSAVDADSAERASEARAAAAAVLVADIDEIALTHGTLDALDIVLGGFPWRPGDRVVTTNVEAPPTVAAVRSLSRLGVDIATVDVLGAVDADDWPERIVAQFERLVTADCRLVVASHVGWSTGTVPPLERIARIVHDRGALLFVDGDRAAGAFAFEPASLGADVYSATGQCWLLGPAGIGAMRIGPRAAELIGPPGGNVLDVALAAGEARAERADARRFERATFDRPSIAGLARSCGWLSMYIGLDWIHERGLWLARRLHDALGGIDGVEILTPTQAMASILAFRINLWRAERALEELERRRFVMARSLPALDAIRVSVGFFNTESELDQLVECVAELARHTPETIPPRRTLTVLGPLEETPGSEQPDLTTRPDQEGR